MSSYLTVLLLYSLILMGIGLFLGRRPASAGSFFVAGRALGPGLIFATVLAANIGAGSTVGAAGLGYRDGLAAWWWVGSAGIGTLLLAFCIGPRIWRVATRQSHLTVGDYLEWRYDARVRLAVTSLLWVATLTILAAQLVAVAFVLQAVARLPHVWGCLIGGVVITVYFSAGGLFTSVWVNVLELVVLLSGLVLALPFVLANAGDWQHLVTAAEPAGSFWHSGASGWGYLPLLVPAFMVSPGLLQKVFAARDERAVRRGIGLAGGVLLLFAIVPPLLGIAARSQAPGLDNPGMALPLVLTAGLPFLLGAFGLVAVFSAEISSADTVLLMLSTSLSEDLYRRYLRPAAADAQILAMARLGALAGGLLATLLAIVLGSVIESMRIFYSVLGVSLFVPIIGGLYSPRAGAGEALAAIVAGVGGYLFGTALGLPGDTAIDPNTLGLGLSAVAFLTVLGSRRLRSRQPVH